MFDGSHHYTSIADSCQFCCIIQNKLNLEHTAVSVYCNWEYFQYNDIFICHIIRIQLIYATNNLQIVIKNSVAKNQTALKNANNLHSLSNFK